MSGRVFLVGAGPGDPGLLTVRAASLLATADVVVTDALVSPEIRSQINASAEILYAGKRAGSHSMSQDEINRRLIEIAASGRTVVRLKGGDPFVFGRGAEEAEELRRAGIEFEVVPGVTAGIAGPAYAGIPVTYRSLATAVTLVTGHESDETSGVSWGALAKVGGTVVFYMGLGKLSEICARLKEAGMPASTPAAVISRATTTRQRSVTGTLDTITGVVETEKIEAPALIVVGDVVRLSEDIGWFEKRPLLGRTVVVTRARAQASELASQLSELGARVVEFPVIRIEPPASWDSLDAIVRTIEGYDWLVFSSTNGVEAFFARLEEGGRDARSLHSAKIAGVGASTAAALRQRGLLTDLMPERYQSAALLPLLPDRMEGERVAIVRAESGSDELSRELEARGAEVTMGIAYRTVGNSSGREELEALLRNREIDVVTFTSGSTVEHFRSALGGEYASLMAGVRIVSIGPVTTTAALESGLEVSATASSASVSALAATVVNVLASPAG